MLITHEQELVGMLSASIMYEFTSAPDLFDKAFPGIKEESHGYTEVFSVCSHAAWAIVKHVIAEFGSLDALYDAYDGNTSLTPGYQFRGGVFAYDIAMSMAAILADDDINHEPYYVLADKALKALRYPSDQLEFTQQLTTILTSGQ